jgi:hypothetical protein
MTLNSHESHDDYADDYDEYDEYYDDEIPGAGSAWTPARALLLLLFLLIVAVVLVFVVLPFLDSLLNPGTDLPPLPPPIQV